MAPRLAVIVAFSLALAGLGAGNELAENANDGEHPPTAARHEAFWPAPSPGNPGPPKGRPPTAARHEAFWPAPSPLNPGRPKGRPPTKVAREAGVPTVPPVWGDPRHPPPIPPQAKRSDPGLGVSQKKNPNVPPSWGNPRQRPPPAKRSDPGLGVSQKKNPNVPPSWGNPRQPPLQAKRSDLGYEDDIVHGDMIFKREQPTVELAEMDSNSSDPATEFIPEKRAESGSEAEASVDVLADAEFELGKRQRCNLAAHVPPDCGLLPPEDGGKHPDESNKERRDDESQTVHENLRRVMGPRRPSARE